MICRPRSSASSRARSSFFAERGEFRSAQIHLSIDADTLRELVNDLIDRLAAAENESQPAHSITLASIPPSTAANEMETFTLSRSGDVAVVTIDDGSTRPTVFAVGDRVAGALHR